MNNRELLHNKIIDLMIEYLGKKIDKNFYEQIIADYLKIYKLEDYLKNIIYYENKEDSMIMGYVSMYNDLLVNVNNVFSSTEKCMKELLSERNITDDEYIVAEFLFYLRTILHELTHIKQDYKIKNKFYDMESQLLRIESSFLHNCQGRKIPKGYTEEQMLDKIDFVLDEYSDRLLCERLAEIEAFEIIQCIAKGFPNLEPYFKEFLKLSLTSGYSLNSNRSINCPTYETMIEIHKIFGINKFDYPLVSSSLFKTKIKTRKYDFDYRLRYGLPISRNELVEFYKRY